MSNTEFRYEHGTMDIFRAEGEMNIEKIFISIIIFAWCLLTSIEHFAENIED